MCGEKVIFAVAQLDAVGSPPRMRGKVTVDMEKRRKPRITPAYAGKRIELIFVSVVCKDHPRVCGEKRRMHFEGC